MKRVAGIVLIFIGVLAGLSALRERILGTPLEQGRSAYRRGDWHASLRAVELWLRDHPRDLESLRIQANDLARLERGSEAITLLGDFGADRLQTADLQLLSDELIKENREVLGLAALIAATKIDPNNRELSKALATLASSKQITRSTARMTDRLASVPSGTGLAELVLDLARADRVGNIRDEPKTVLACVLRSDRDVLLRIDGPSAARKLVARKLLELGRAGEAQSWLGQVTEEGDPETNWLLSRALLVEGKTEAANVAAVAAGAFGKDDLTVHEPAPYVGAKRCSKCHRTIYQDQQQSAHASTVASGDALMAVPVPREPIVDPHDPNVTYRIERKGGKLRLESRVHGQVVSAVLDYALGSGRHGMTMIAREGDDSHRQLRVSYYSTGGDHWGLTSGFEREPKDLDSFIGQPLSEEGFVGCLNCHTTRFVSEKERTGPEAIDHGIGCERCHGPGDHHLRSVELGFSELAIARPKLATPAQRLKLCKECHGADGVIPPTDPRYVRFQSANFPYSRCVTESNGRLDCVGCHDPHRNVVTDNTFYEAICLNCHGGSKPDRSPRKSNEHPIEAVAASSCPINMSSGCIGCHMPKAREVVPFTDFTDHHIRVHKNGAAE